MFILGYRLACSYKRIFVGGTPYVSHPVTSTLCSDLAPPSPTLQPLPLCPRTQPGSFCRSPVSGRFPDVSILAHPFPQLWNALRLDSRLKPLRTDLITSNLASPWNPASLSVCLDGNSFALLDYVLQRLGAVLVQVCVRVFVFSQFLEQIR